MQDPGKHGMPPISAFVDGKQELPMVVQLDATGFGSQQFNTIVVRNPYMSASAQQLRIFGVGNCGDDRGGSTRLLGPNLAEINSMIRVHEQECDVCVAVGRCRHIMRADYTRVGERMRCAIYDIISDM